MIRKDRGLSTIFFLAMGIIIGVIIVVLSASLIKWRLSSNPVKHAASSPIPAASPAASIEATHAESRTAAPRESTDASRDKEKAATGESVQGESARLDLVKDPVCGKLVNPNTDFQYKFKTHTFCFCSEQCMRTFEDDPLPYIDFTMKVQVTIQPLTGNSPGSTESAKPTPEVALPKEHTPTGGGSTLRELPPIKEHTLPSEIALPKEHKGGGSSTPAKIAPTPEEIPLSDERPPVKTTKTTAPPATKTQPAKGKPAKELQIEEIPLE
jgi:YHS domain-containing protein